MHSFVHSAGSKRHHVCFELLDHGVVGGLGRDGSGMIQALYIYCALYFLPIAAADLTRSISLWPGGWGPLNYTKEHPALGAEGSRGMTPLEGHKS